MKKPVKTARFCDKINLAVFVVLWPDDFVKSLFNYCLKTKRDVSVYETLLFSAGGSVEFWNAVDILYHQYRRRIDGRICAEAGRVYGNL